MGGNVFAGRTSSINIENIKPTLDAYFAELVSLFPKKAPIFTSSTFIPLGSVGKKKVSGDIDLGVDSRMLFIPSIANESISDWGIDLDEVNSNYEKMLKRAKTSTPEQIKMKAFLFTLVRFINKNAPNIHCDEKKVTPGNIFGLFPQVTPTGEFNGQAVQIDWMVGDIGWLEFSYYSSAYPENSNVKGLHRTQLLLAAFQQAGYSFNHVSGVKDKSTGQVIASTPEAALRLLSDKWGIQLKRGMIENYYLLHHRLEEIPKYEYDGIIDTYFKILDSTRCDIPDDLQEEWLRRKSALGLTGKFLPEDSKLKDTNEVV